MDYVELSIHIFPLDPGREVLVAELSQLGFESFIDTDEGIHAYIQKDQFDKDLLETLTVLCNPIFEVKYSTKVILERNWNAEWEKNFESISIDDKCLIRAPFHEKDLDYKYDVVINPQMSFGTGHHATTYLMAQELLKLDLEGKHVLDMGCGTGILAIIAELKGANSVLAVDTDNWAYENTKENIRNNSCNIISVKKGGAELLKDTIFDVVLANINTNVLLEDMDIYAHSLSPKGELLLSGFMLRDGGKLMDKASGLGLKKMVKGEKNEWLMLHLVKE